MRCFLFLIVALTHVMSIFCYGQTAVTIPANFVETALPKAGSQEWAGLNRSQNAFGVKITNGNLEVKRVNEVNSTQLKITKGTLIGLDHGEWGGKLLFKPASKIKKSIEIKSGNIKFIFLFQDKIYFIEGIAHLSISEGALYKLNISGGKFTYQKIVDFEDSPQAFTVYRDSLLIATFQNFYLVKDSKKELVFKDTFWRSLYPNSIATVDGRNVFLGIRGGIVQLDLVTKTMKFYKPKD